MKNVPHRYIIEQVPPNYYQKGIRENLLQRLWHINKLNEVLKACRTQSRVNNILDVGCASGWLISQIAHRYPKASCSGIDIYDKAIKYAKRKYPHIEFKVADAHKLPFKSNAFDLVVCTEVLEHVDDPRSVLFEIKRVLKNKGTAVIELDSGSLLFSIVWYLWRKSKGRIWNESHAHSFNIRKLEKMILSCDFKIIKKEKFNLGMAMIFTVIK